MPRAMIMMMVIIHDWGEVYDTGMTVGWEEKNNHSSTELTSMDYSQPTTHLYNGMIRSRDRWTYRVRVCDVRG